MTTKEIIRAAFVSAAVTGISLPLLLLIVNKKYAIQVAEPDRYGAAMAVFLFGVALVATLAHSSWKHRSSDIPPSVVDQTGVVKWFNTAKGFGFITLEGGRDVFVHYRDILGTGHRTLSAGQKVAFRIAKSQKGPQAQNVTVLG